MNTIGKQCVCVRVYVYSVFTCVYTYTQTHAHKYGEYSILCIRIYKMRMYIRHFNDTQKSLKSSSSKRHRLACREKVV